MPNVIRNNGASNRIKVYINKRVNKEEFVLSNFIKIQVRLKEGEVFVEAPGDALELVFTKLELFLPNLIQVSQSIFQENHVNKVEPSNFDKDEEIQSSGEDKFVELRSSKRKRSASSRLESYKVVDIGLSPEQRVKYKEFYDEKKPANQNQQLLVAMYWLKKEANKPLLSKDEIYTGLKTVNARIPARISSVLSNLMLEGKVVSEKDGNYSLTHIGEDFVNYDLPAKKKPT